MSLRVLLVVLSACVISLARRFESNEQPVAPPEYDGRFDEVDELPQAPEDLQYAFVIFRHGIRSPIYLPFQTKEEFNVMWPEGLGALTDDGKRLMIHVGESLRTRYKNVVPEFDEDVVTFTSTHSGRATMSAYSVAAGLFPTDQPIFEEALLSWQPIPVWQNTPYDKHKLFSQPVPKSQCKRYTEMREEARSVEKKRTPKLRKDYYRLLNSCIFKTFHKQRSFADSLQDNSKAYDIFKAQMLNQKPVPAWVPKAMPAMEKMKQMRMWSFIHSKPNMVQYFTGPLFNQILTEMQHQSVQSVRRNSGFVKEAEEKNYKALKMHFHGSHDITVCPTVWSISKDETYLALPGDTVIIEMSTHAFIRAYLYVPLENDKSKRFTEILLEPLCGSVDCRLTEFKDALKDLAFNEAEWKRRCNDEPYPKSGFRPFPQDINRDDIKLMREAEKLVNEAEKLVNEAEKSTNKAKKSANEAEKPINVVAKSYDKEEKLAKESKKPLTDGETPVNEASKSLNLVETL